MSYTEDYGEISYVNGECLFYFPRQFKIEEEFNCIQEFLENTCGKKGIFQRMNGEVIFNGRYAVGELCFIIDPLSSQILDYNKEKLLSIMNKVSDLL